MYIPLKTIKFIEQEFEKELQGYSIKEYQINEFERLLVVEDSLVLYEEIVISEMPVCENAYDVYKDKVNEFFEIPQKNHKYYTLQIEELTFNNIGFKHSNDTFRVKMQNITGIDYIWCNYTKFKGLYRQVWDCVKGGYVEQPTKVKLISEKFPELKLEERCKNSFTFYVIAIEVEAFDNNKGIGIFYTQEKPHKYMVNRCRNWIKQGFTYGNMNMIYNVNGKFPRNNVIEKYPYHMESALETWKNKGFKRQEILENHLKYFYFEKTFDNKDDVNVYADRIFEQICLDKLTNIEKYTYLKPENRWITEELVYKLCKKIYKGHKVIYQYRPFFLHTTKGGQMSYDIFISGLNIAIEYQGKQHFEPVDFFGGEKGYKKTVERDKLKRKLSEINGIKLVYINYWEDVTIDLIKEKIESI